MLKRAYAMMTVRSVSDGEDQRVFEGWATTPAPDRLGDVIDPMGAKFKNPLALLHQHDSTLPIGTVKLKRATPEGIEFSATIPKIAEPGTLKDRVDTAWGEIKAGLVRAVSIGFRVLQDGVENLGNTGGLKFTGIEIMELSTVSVPANAEATITNIKSFDVGALAASGLPVVKLTKPGVAGAPLKPQTKGATMRTFSEKIEDFQSAISLKRRRMEELDDARDKRGETFDPAEIEEFDSLHAEVKSAEAQIDRLRVLETGQARQAIPVTRAQPGDVGRILPPTDFRSEPQPIVRSIETVEPSIRVARLAKCMVLARTAGGIISPLEIANQQYPNDGVLPEMVRAAVGAGTVTNPTWAGALVGPAGLAFAAFLEFLRPQTILGKFGVGDVPNLQMVPFRTPLGAQTSGGAGFWVGEGKAKPLTKFDFTRTQLTELKVANIAVATMELIRDSSPSADVLIRNGLVAALRERLDTDFIDPAKAAVAGVSPASITNGVAGIPSVGNTSDEVRQDVGAIYAAYKVGNNPLLGGVWIMNTQQALNLGLMVNLLGQPEFPGISVFGGNFQGFPVISSDYVPMNTVVLANAPLIYLADEGGFSVAMSQEASLEMLDNPIADAGAPTPPATAMVSMFQTNSVAILAERTINWTKARTNAAVMLTGVHWGEPGP
jgi:HK97 family phage prohead protease